MPPQAGGFRYTPTAYLQKVHIQSGVAGGWSETDKSDSDDQIKLKPRTNRKPLPRDDQTFQSRVARKKNQYRNMLKRDGNQRQQLDINDDSFYNIDGSYSNTYDDGYGSTSDFYSSNNESSSGSFPPQQHSRAYTETCNRYTEGHTEVPSVSTQEDQVSPSLVKVAARVARQKRIKEESAHHRAAEARFQERKSLKSPREVADARMLSDTVDATTTRQSLSSASGSSKPQNSEKIFRAHRNRRIMEASEDERETLEELRARRAREEEEARLSEEREREAAKKRLEQAKGGKTTGHLLDKEIERKRRQLDDYERSQREAEEASRRAAQEDREMQEKWRKESMDILEGERKQQRSLSKKDRRGGDKEARRSRGSRSSSNHSKRSSKSSSSRRTRHRLLKSSSDAFDPEHQHTLMEEFHELLRESGFFRTCVSSCFGDERDLCMANDILAPGGEDTSQSSGGSGPTEL